MNKIYDTYKAPKDRYSLLSSGMNSKSDADIGEVLSAPTSVKDMDKTIAAISVIAAEGSVSMEQSLVQQATSHHTPLEVAPANSVSDQLIAAG